MECRGCLRHGNEQRARGRAPLRFARDAGPCPGQCRWQEQAANKWKASKARRAEEARGCWRVGRDVVGDARGMLGRAWRHAGRATAPAKAVYTAA